MKQQYEELIVTIGLEGETLVEGEADEMQEEESYVDDFTGGLLDPDLFREARLEESAGYREMQVYCRVPVDRDARRSQVCKNLVSPLYKRNSIGVQDRGIYGGTIKEIDPSDFHGSTQTS